MGGISRVMPAHAGIHDLLRAEGENVGTRHAPE